MKPTWLIHNYDQEEFDKIKAALDFTETPYQEVIYQSIMDEIDVSTLPPTDACVVVYGSIQFAKALLKQNLTYTPGAYGFSSKTDCSNYFPKIPEEYLLNYPYALTTWAELRRSKDYFKNLFSGTSMFIRPNSGNKIFAGQNIYHDFWSETVKTIEQTSGVSDETLIVIGKNKPIKPIEYRFVIVDKKVVSGSSYNWAKVCTTEFPKETEELAQKIADLDWQIDTAYTCDVAVMPYSVRVIELNSFSCAGLYACDRIKIVEAVNTAALLEHRDVYD